APLVPSTTLFRSRLVAGPPADPGRPPPRRQRGSLWRPAVLRDPGRDPRRPDRLRAVLCVRRVPRQPAEPVQGVGGRHELPWRVAWGGRRGLVVVAQAPAAPDGHGGLRRTTGAAGAGARAAGQLHRRRVVGAVHGKGLGRGVPGLGPGAVHGAAEGAAAPATRLRSARSVRPPSLAALPGGPGGAGHVLRTVVVLAQAAPALCRRRAVRAAVRLLPFPGGVRAG